MTVYEKASLQQLANQFPKVASPISPLDAIQWAEEHLFERRSVVNEHELWRHALERVRGQIVSLADIQAVTRQRGYLRFDQHPGQVSTREQLERELEIIQKARTGVDDCYPLVWEPKPFNPKLDDEQREALAALVSNINRISVFRGGAGTGKSFVLSPTGEGASIHRGRVAKLERDSSGQ